MKRTEMKKLLSLIALVLALSLALFGCGKSDDAEGEADGGADVSADVQTEEGADAGEAEGTTADGAGDAEALLQQMLDELQPALDAQNEVNEELNIMVSKRGESIVYTYTYLIDLPETEGLTDTFEATADAQSAVFDGMANQLKEAGLESPSVIIEYLTKDGETIWAKEFTGEQSQ